jgi:hypothetical protein
MGIFYNPPPPGNQGPVNSTPPLPHAPQATGESQPPRRQVAAALAMVAVLASWPADLEPRLHPKNASQNKIAPLTLTYGAQPTPTSALSTLELAQLVATWAQTWGTQTAPGSAAWNVPPTLVVLPHVPAQGHIWTASEPPWVAPPRPVTIAPLALVYGQQPPINPPLSVVEYGQLVGAWAQGWAAQRPPKNGWNVSAAGGNAHTVKVATGSGYSDVSAKQIVRTSGNVAYAIATNCDTYPCTSSTQTVRVWKADQAGLPTSFTRKDTANEPANAGSCAAAIDGSDNIHIVWQDRGTPKVRYAVFNTASDTWGTKEDVDASIGAVPDAGQGDAICAIALDSAGKPHVAYLYLNTIRRLAYRNRVSGAWSSLTAGIDDNTYTGNRKAWNPNLAFDTAGRRVFAWSVGAFNGDTDGQQCIRVMDTDDTLGTRADVGAATAKVGIDQSTSLLCNGTIHTAWILGGTVPNEFVRYAYATESKNPSFSTNHPANADTHNPSIGYGDAGKIRLYGHGSESPNDDNLYYWEGTGGAGAWSGRNAYSTGNFDSSVSARWSQYFYNQPTYADVVYWDATYPNDLYYGGDLVTAPPAAPAFPVVPLPRLIWTAWEPPFIAPPKPVQAVTLTLATGTAPSPSSFLSVTELTYLVGTWQQTWSAQQAAPTAAWNVPPLLVSLPRVPVPSHVWTASELPWVAPPRPVQIAPLTLVYGAQPTPQPALSVPELTQTVAMWPQAWEAQRAPSSASWNVPPAAAPPHINPPQALWTAWEPPFVPPPRPVTVAPLTMVYGTAPRPASPIRPATWAVILGHNPAPTWAAQAMAPTTTFMAPTNPPAIADVTVMVRTVIDTILIRPTPEGIDV